jgi:FAD/FMN-containing dehydrogenase/ferredoxin
MSGTSFLERTLGHSAAEVARLGPGERGALAQAAIPDLHLFFNRDAERDLARRAAPERTRALARSLFDAISALPEGEAARRTLPERLVTDAFLRSEADRDQNVYLGAFFTGVLTRAVPDLIFQPIDFTEAAGALAWARRERVPVTLRGAGSTAMGGSVPQEAGLTLDLSRFDAIDIDAADGVCVVGAGARLRTVHARLAERGLALKAYPSNLGGTLAGWFATGGIGMNAYAHGRALDTVRSADALLPDGTHVRFHDDGRLDVPDGARRKTLAADASAAWFRARGCEPIALADLAGSEGIHALLVRLTVRVERRPEIGAFLLAFARREDALEATAWIRRSVGARFPLPANVKHFSASHLRHTRAVWAEEDGRAWRERPGALATDEGMPWTRIAGPAELGAAGDRGAAQAAASGAEACLFVDFLGLGGAREFATALPSCPGAPAVLDAESVRFARERFRPQQTKRLGPGLLAAEILMPADEVGRFLPSAEDLLRNIGTELDAEVYYLADGGSLVIAGYLVDHRRAGFAVELSAAPVLADLAMRRHDGRPYVLGRWQAAFARRALGEEAYARAARSKRALDPDDLVNRGVHLRFALPGALGGAVSATFLPGIALLRAAYASALLSPLARAARALLGAFPGPAHGRGEPAAHAGADHARAGREPLPASARALHCVNCGECNSVCPIFHESKIRLPQMLTHLGEARHGGDSITGSGSVLLDLCMRCGNCEEVCQAGIPHLALYETMQGASDAAGGGDRERHVAILAAVRGSTRYLHDFLGGRPGGYVKRTPVSLPGVTRYVLLRAENDAGPGATCIHCGACVSVCPTNANQEFQGDDPRWITTEQDRCIGCGTCVEVCPANLANGGQTLRVFEAPTGDWFAALDEFEARQGREGA